MTPREQTTSSALAQRLTDHENHQGEQFDNIDKRLVKIEMDVSSLLSAAGTKFQNSVRMLVPVILSLAIVAGGWVWGLSRQESKISELENGRLENKGNISVLMKQAQDQAVAGAIRDVRYEEILSRLKEIQEDQRGSRRK
jgi:Tfp pilus assembly protein PilO